MSRLRDHDASNNVLFGTISTSDCADHLSHVTLDFGTGLLYNDTAVLF